MSDDEKERIYKKDKRKFLKTKKEKEESKEETEKCDVCGAPEKSWAFNCGKDCIFHKSINEERCICKNKDKAGLIESRNYCTFKRTKRNDLDIENIEILALRWLYV